MALLSTAHIRVLLFTLLSFLVTASAVVATLNLKAPSVKDLTMERQLTQGTWDDLDLVFSPDGKKIAFASNRSGNFDIWLMDIDGRHQVRLTSLEGDERQPSWDVDGKSIAFVWKHGEQSKLCVVSISTGLLKCVSRTTYVGSYALSPSGGIIVYDDSIAGTIHLYDLTSEEDFIFPFSGVVKDPALSVDGRLYFAAKTQDGFSIWSANLDGSEAEQLSSFGKEAKPQPSPKGNKVLYLTNYSGYYEPWLVDTKGKDNRYLFDRPHIVGYDFPPAPNLAQETVPRWTSDGTQVLMVDSSYALLLVTLDTLVEIPLGSLRYLLNVPNKIHLISL